MLTVQDIMRETGSCFPRERFAGEARVRRGRLEPDLFGPGEWVAISGSASLDGIHQLDSEGCLAGAADTAFSGRLTALRPPADFLRLCGEIIAWEAERPADGLRSERFGGYAAERAVGENGLPLDWRHVFAGRLARWRRMFPEEELTW